MAARRIDVILTPETTAQLNPAVAKLRRWTTAIALTTAGMIISANVRVTVPLLWPMGSTAVAALLLKLLFRHGRYRRESDIGDGVRKRTPPTVRLPSAGIHNARIGDAHRDAAADDLQKFYAAGYLNPEEFEDRLGAVMRATHRVDLQQALHELPADELS